MHVVFVMYVRVKVRSYLSKVFKHTQSRARPLAYPETQLFFQTLSSVNAEDIKIQIMSYLPVKYVFHFLHSSSHEYF